MPVTLPKTREIPAVDLALARLGWKPEALDRVWQPTGKRWTAGVVGEVVRISGEIFGLRIYTLGFPSADGEKRLHGIFYSRTSLCYPRTEAEHRDDVEVIRLLRRVLRDREEMLNR